MAAKQTLIVDGKDIALDPDGHLLATEDWSEAVATEMARLDGISLCPLRWWLIHFVRLHYHDYGMPPLMRVAVTEMRRDTGLDDISSRTLYRLFPDGPIREGCRYAGLPRPEACI